MDRVRYTSIDPHQLDLVVERHGIGSDDVPDSEMIERLYEAIERLPKDEREAIEKLWLTDPGSTTGPRPRGGVPLSRVAEEMGIMRPTLRKLERRALEHLRELILDNGDEGE